jgi:hypothetical protein
MRWGASIAAAAALLWSSGTALAATDLTPFLAQYECPDGQAPGFCPGQPLHRAEHSGAVHTRYRDWSVGGCGWMTADNVHWFNSGGHQFFYKIWSWDDPCAPSNSNTVRSNPGNGGEVYELYKNSEGHFEARILGTRDVSQDTNQFFNPCEDHGWVIADDKVPSGRWAERNYGQRGTTGSPGCPEPLNHGWTQSRLEWINFPLQRPDGWIYYFNRPAIISSQYNNDSFDHANRSENFVCIEFHGCRVWWLCLKGEDKSADEQLDYRNPKMMYVVCPAGWHMADIRATFKYFPGQNLIPSSYGWPW